MKNIKIDSSNAEKWALLKDLKVVPYSNAPKEDMIYWCKSGDKKWTRYVPHKPKKEENAIPK